MCGDYFWNRFQIKENLCDKFCIIKKQLKM
jgi:hypothetical protein